MRPRVLVYGWYGRGNVGDELFRRAFEHLFPSYEFIYVDRITKALLEGASAVFFGGGSFLGSEPIIDHDAWSSLKIPIFYMGVGLETEIHPTHRALMSTAKLIATRSPESLFKGLSINPNTYHVLDMVYALKNPDTVIGSVEKSVLVLPNIELVPVWNGSLWHHTAWEFFKNEFAQFLDTLVNDGYSVRFFSMCQSEVMNDSWAAQEIVNRMNKRSSTYILDTQVFEIEELAKLFSEYEIVITQRYHGVVLAELFKTPYVAIHHHDKIKHVSPCHGTLVPYYGSAKENFTKAFEREKNTVMGGRIPSSLPMAFSELVSRVNSFIA